MVRYAIGCMTGTSLDGLDAVLVEAEGTGLNMRVRAIAHAEADLGELKDDLRAVAAGSPTSAGDFARIALRLGELHAMAIEGLVEREGVRLAACALPGQTVFHRPPNSLQLINPWPVALRLGCPVLHDLRGADIAAGGQGAPITPIADWVLFRSESEDRAIVNLGGYCNVTTLPAGSPPPSVRGFDVCACNQVLDACARSVLGRPFDTDGRAARAGTPDESATAELSHMLQAQASAGRSLGTGDECTGWVEQHAPLAPSDLMASAAWAVGTVVGERLADLGNPILAGGGSRNRALVAAIERVAGPCKTTADHGVDVQHREAGCIAVLGLLALDGVRYTLHGATGRAVDLSAEGSWIGVLP